METKRMFFKLYLAFDLIGIQTYLARQNVHQHLCFVKDIHVVSKKRDQNGHEITKRKGCDI